MANSRVELLGVAEYSTAWTLASSGVGRLAAAECNSAWGTQDTASSGVSWGTAEYNSN